MNKVYLFAFFFIFVAAFQLFLDIMIMMTVKEYGPALKRMVLTINSTDF